MTPFFVNPKLFQRFSAKERLSFVKIVGVSHLETRGENKVDQNERKVEIQAVDSKNKKKNRMQQKC